LIHLKEIHQSSASAGIQAMATALERPSWLADLDQNAIAVRAGGGAMATDAGFCLLFC